ncbi:MAG: hypothetical protein KGH94_04520 [Candidatus Micrarchaeota archaeon]|nr:hypothetical protein [Candidatus Micrarchaeota archaeon]
MARGRERSSQSAIEFLMTYGWAIVAVTVALGVLYSLGIFGFGANSTSGCAVLAGFSCTKPVLYSSGSMTIGFGQVGGTKTITATGCSSNSTAPTAWETTSITLQSGQVSNLTFQCPGFQGKQLGSTYQGTLWIQYYGPSGGGSVTQQIATIKVPVTGSGLPGIPLGSSYVPITLTNAQANATGSNFQEMINVSANLYTANEASDLGNIRFYQGSTQLYSWCESGCLVGSAKAVFWVKIPGGIGADSNTVIDMVLENTISVDYDGIYAGESPLQSVTGYQPSSSKIKFATNVISVSSPSGITVSPSLSGANMWICGIAEGNGFRAHTSMSSVFSDEFDYIVLAGLGTSSGCSASYNVDGGTGQNSWSGVGVALNTNGIAYRTEEADNGTYCSTACNSVPLGITTAGTSFVVLVGGCSQGSGNPGVDVRCGLNNLPSGCTGSTTTYDTYESALIYVCNSLSAGSYTVTISTNSGNDADMMLAAYIFQNTTSVPQSYALHDNGANVFSYYQNFAGTSCPSGWGCTGTVNNGLFALGGTGPAITYISNTTGGALDFYGEAYASPNYLEGVGECLLQPGGINPVEACLGYNPFGSGPHSDAYGSSYGGGGAFSPQPSFGNHVWSYSTNLKSSTYASYDYGSTIYDSQNYIVNQHPDSFTSMQIVARYGGQLNVFWLRTRAYPPNGAMPSASFGSISS